ncbi:MAG: hypothetical protein K2W78_10960 [Xanthobacteraceae bacterium]|nr:hypothetical protein [Xanthobacteraceae bacterium]
MTKLLSGLAASATMVGALLVFSAPARADRCDDLAKQLAQQIDNLKVGGTRGGIIYLQHPTAVRASLGCSSRNKQAEFYAASSQKKPSADFVSFVATASALVFTIPKDDALRGTKRCLGRIGLLRGYDVSTRYRKLDIHCARTSNGANITVSREKEN